MGTYCPLCSEYCFLSSPLERTLTLPPISSPDIISSVQFSTMFQGRWELPPDLSMTFYGSDFSTVLTALKSQTTHHSILPWKIPHTEEPGGLQSLESQSLTRLSNWSIHILREKIRWKELENGRNKNSSLLFSVIDITYPKSISDYISSLKFTKQFH